MPTFLRLLARLPLGVLYGVATLVYWVAFRLLRFRAEVVEQNLAKAFPDLDPAARAQLSDRYHRQIADVAVEVLKGFAIAPRELRERVTIEGLDAVRGRLDAGQSVLLVAAHHCNWEWALLALSLELGHPLDAVYKPLKTPWAERAFYAMRTRFGGRLTPAKEIVTQVLARKGEVRAVAMVADQVPSTSPSKFWTKFLGLDTAFYMGAEEIARAVGYPVYFVAMERVARGRYVVRLSLLAERGNGLEIPKETTRRYAVALERMLREHPADWFWSHNRWKLKKPLYAR